VDTGERVDVVRRPTIGAFELFGYLEPAGKRLWIQSESGSTQHVIGSNTAPQDVDRCPRAVSAGSRWEAYGAISQRRGHAALALWTVESDRPWLEFSNDDLSPCWWAWFSPDDRYLAWASRSGTISVADLPALRQAVADFEKDLPARD
jgi:hypothetical protein